MKSLLIIDNQEITRYGVRTLAESKKLFASILELETKAQLLSALAAKPDSVVLLDYTAFDVSPEQLLVIKERYGKARWILFSESLSENFIRRMIIDGHTFSVVMKSATVNELIAAFQTAIGDGQYLCSRALGILRDHGSATTPSPLTPTEQEILKSIALGKSTKEIAAERFISNYTVMTHRKNIFRKINVNNVYEATKYALRAGIVQSVEYYI